MSDSRSFREIIFRPNIIQSIIFTIICIIFIALSVVVSFSGSAQESIGYLQYIVYALGATSLIYLIYLTYYYIQNFKKAREAGRFEIKNPYIKRIFTDYAFRSKLFTFGALTMAFLLMVYHTAYAIANKSSWNGIMGLYFSILLLLYGIIVVGIVSRQFTQKQDVQTYMFVAIGIIVIPAALIWAEFEILSGGYNVAYGGNQIYAVALYTFIKIGMAVGNLKVTSGVSDNTLKAFRAVMFIDALVSLMTLQLSMYISFAENLQPSFISHGMFCAIISLVCVGIGAYMIYKYARKLSKNIMYNNTQNMHNNTDIESK